MNKLRMKANEKGFTLIELMIVIAIIGILAAIAIPNYISYRDKAFCSAAESDANALAGGLSDYFAIPANQGFHNGASAHAIQFTGNSTITLSGTNTGTVAQIGATNQFRISVTDRSGRCPTTYQNGSSRWTGGVYMMTM